MSRPVIKDKDPDLVDIDELSDLERARHHTARRIQARSTVLILATVAFLVLLGIVAVWIAEVF